MDQLIEGRKVAQKIKEFLQKKIKEAIVKGHPQPKLCVIQVGDDPASQVYVASKKRQAIEIGMLSEIYTFPPDANEARILEKIRELNDDKQVHGILVQLPLPPHLSPNTIMNTICPEKDVDGLHPLNLGKLITGQEGFYPCTPLGCRHLLHSTGVPLQGKKALIIGRSRIVGLPLSLLLIQAHCTVTVAHSFTTNLEHECLQADILIAAIGQANFIKGEWIKKGAIVLDVGISRVHENGTTVLTGDVHFKTALAQANKITPVPGGVGPMTIAYLLFNTYRGYALTQNLEVPRYFEV